MKFVFDKKFKFFNYPQLLKCHKEYNALVDKSYEMEELFEAGKYTKEQLLQASERSRYYFYNDYAYQVYLEFYGKGLMICEWNSKKPICFDNMFPSKYEDLSKIERGILTGLVETRYGWKLSREFYE